MNPTLSFSQNRRVALFLSGLILPGLGQIHLGEKKKGWTLLLMVIVVTIFTLSKFMMGVLKATEQTRFARPPSLHIWKTLLIAYEMEKAWVIGGLLLIIALWVLSVIDIGLRGKKR